MEKSHQSTFIDYIVLLFRRMLVFAIIVAVAALALFWESLPGSVKKTVTTLSGGPSDDERMAPPKFRINPPSLIETTDIRQPESVEYRNTQENERLAHVVFVQLHEELKQLGAISCRLTYWGDSGNMFRFSCQVPVSEQNPNATRTFQSIAPDAIQSIREVIDQVRRSFELRDQSSESRSHAKSL